MNNYIAHTSDGFPIHIWIIQFNFLWNMLDGFTDDFDVTNNRLEPHFVTC